MSGFIEAFAIEALFTGVRMMAGGLRAFFEQDALGRLLILIHAQFGEQAGLSRRDVLAWRSDAAVEGALLAALAAEASDDAFNEELTSAIEAALASSTAVPAEGRRAVAEQVAGFVFAAVPYAAEGGSQAHALVLSRLEQGQQSILDALSDGQDDAAPDLARALVIGPLRYAGGVEDVAEADRRAAAGDDAGAAGLLLLVAQRLDELGVAFAAETLRERVAAHLAVARSVEAAAETLLAVADGRLERGASVWAERSIDTLRDLLGDELAPLADAVSARGSWPGDIDGALARLEAGAAAARSVGRDDVERWEAHHIELLTFTERWQEAVDAAGVLADAECEEGARLHIILDVLEAREALSGPEPVEARWLDVLRWADTEAEPRWRAVVWQRRGLALARREQVDGAFDAYRRATAAWAEVPGHEEQAADSFFSMQAVARMTARQPPEIELRPVAWTVRGSSDAPVAVADRLEREAMDKRLTGRLPDALSGYLHALLINRRVGSLQGLLQDFERLGELYAHAGEHGLALTCFIRAGQAGKASQAAGQIGGEELADRLSVTGPRWERAAAMHAIADVGRTLPEALVAEISDELLAQAASEPDAWVAPQPALTARRALAAVALAAPLKSRPAVFDALTGQLGGGLPDQQWAATQALTLATRAGLTDARAALTQHYIEDPHNSRVSSLWLGEQARTHVSVSEPLLAAAVDGDAAILEPLAIANLIGPQLQEQVDAATTRAADVVTVERREENGQVTVLGRHGHPPRRAGDRGPRRLSRSSGGPDRADGRNPHQHGGARVEPVLGGWGAVQPRPGDGFEGGAVGRRGHGAPRARRLRAVAIRHGQQPPAQPLSDQPLPGQPAAGLRDRDARPDHGQPRGARPRPATCRRPRRSADRVGAGRLRRVRRDLALGRHRLRA